MYHGLASLVVFVHLVAGINLSWRTGSSHTAFNAVAREQPTIPGAVAETRFMDLIASTSVLDSHAVDHLRQNNQLSSVPVTSDCSVRSMHAFKLRCEEGDLHEKDRITAAVIFTLCELNTGTTNMIPPACAPWDVNQLQSQSTTQSIADPGDCVTALQLAGLRGTYSTYYQDAGKLCNVYGKKRDKTELRMIVQDIPIVLSRGMHEAMLKHADYTTTWLHDVETASNAERERFKETMQTSLAEEMERQRDLHREDATALKQNLWDPLQRVVDHLGRSSNGITKAGDEVASKISAMTVSLESRMNALGFKLETDIGIMLSGLISQMLIKYDAEMSARLVNATNSLDTRIFCIMQKLTDSFVEIMKQQTIFHEGVATAHTSLDTLVQAISDASASTSAIDTGLRVLREKTWTISKDQDRLHESVTAYREHVERSSIELRSQVDELKTELGGIRVGMNQLAGTVQKFISIFSFDLASTCTFLMTSWVTWAVGGIFLFVLSNPLYQISMMFGGPMLSIFLSSCALWWKILQFGRVHVTHLLLHGYSTKKTQALSSVLPTLISPDPPIKSELYDRVIQYDDTLDDEELERDLTPDPRELMHDDVQEDYMHQIRRLSSVYSSTDCDTSSVSSCSDSHSRLLDDLARHVVTLKYTGHSHRRVRTDLATLSVIRAPYRSQAPSYKSRIFLPSRDF